mmetsp:Transcript_21020/g.40727  ORF Transcript_21020/g.40727 Transcript_21020/m.40727 type:complete len:205 (-) Transcript_21020:966-1580(-)
MLEVLVRELDHLQQGETCQRVLVAVTHVHVREAERKLVERVQHAVHALVQDAIVPGLDLPGKRGVLLHDVFAEGRLEEGPGVARAECGPSDRLQRGGLRVGDLDVVAEVVDAGHVAHPAGRGQGEHRRRRARLGLLVDDGQHGRLHLRGAVLCEPLDLVLDVRVREAVEQLGLVPLQVDAGNGRDGLGDLREVHPDEVVHVLVC